MATHYGGGITLSQAIEFNAKAPLDIRGCVNTKDDLATILYPCYGLWTWCLEDQQFYVYTVVDNVEKWVKYEPTPTGQVYIFQKSVTAAEFAAIDTSKLQPGYVYNITEKVTIGTKTYPAGTNLAWTSSGTWDALGGDGVTDVQQKVDNTVKSLVDNTTGVATLPDLLTSITNKTDNDTLATTNAIINYMNDNKGKLLSLYASVWSLSFGQTYYIPLKVFAASSNVNPTSNKPGLYDFYNTSKKLKKDNIISEDIVEYSPMFDWNDTKNTKDSKNTISSNLLKYSATFFFENSPALFDMFQVIIDYNLNEAHIIKLAYGNNDVYQPFLLLSTEISNYYVLGMKLTMPKDYAEALEYAKKWGSDTVSVFAGYLCLLAETLDTGKLNNICPSDGFIYTSYNFSSDYWKECPIVDMLVHDVQDLDGNTLVTDNIATVPLYKGSNTISISDDYTIDLLSHLKVTEINLEYNNLYPLLTYPSGFVGLFSLYSYNILCELNGNTLKVGNSNYDNLLGKTVETESGTTGVIKKYNTDTNTTILYTQDSVKDENQYIHFFHGNSCVGIGMFKIVVNDTANNINETHYILETLRSGRVDTTTGIWDGEGEFGIETSLNWNVSSYFCSNSTLSNYTTRNTLINTTSGAARQYDMDSFIEVPKDFVGSVEISLVWFITSSAVNNFNRWTITEYGSKSTPTIYTWSSDTQITYTSPWTKTQIDSNFLYCADGTQNLAGDNYGKHQVDFIADFGSDVKVGDYLSDIIVNDYILHYLSKQMNSIQTDLSGFEMTKNKKDEINNDNKTSTTYYPSISAIVNYISEMTDSDVTDVLNQTGFDVLPTV